MRSSSAVLFPFSPLRPNSRDFKWPAVFSHNLLATKNVLFSFFFFLFYKRKGDTEREVGRGKEKKHGIKRRRIMISDRGPCCMPAVHYTLHTCVRLCDYCTAVCSNYVALIESSLNWMSPVIPRCWRSRHLRFDLVPPNGTHTHTRHNR